MSHPVVIRALHDLPDLEAAVDLQKTVWQFADRDLVPVTELVAADHNDGIVLGAFEEDKLVGFLFSFVGRRAGRFLQYSRMLAVHPDQRGRGIGAALKLEQKRASLDRGYTWMEWTFDPLEARNASLNLRRLGARVRRYHENIYGQRTSQFDRGVPTDRFLAEWDLNEDLSVTGEARRSAHRTAIPAFAVERRGTLPRPGGVDLDPAAPAVLIPVPLQFQPIRESDRDLSLEWRMAVREAAESALAAGFHVVDFLPGLPGAPGCGAHVLAPDEAT